MKKYFKRKNPSLFGSLKELENSYLLFGNSEYLIFTMQDLCESPMLISDTEFNLDVEVHNQALLNKLLSSCSIVDEYQNIPIYKSGDHFFTFDEKADLLTYVVKFIEGKMDNFKLDYVTQVKVWRSADTTLHDVHKVPEYVFWKYLFPLHNCVMTDANQTDKGARFWVSRTIEARKKGLFVYIVDIKEGTASRSINPQGFQSDPRLYGSEMKHWDMRILISKEDVLKDFLVEQSIFDSAAYIKSNED